MIVCELTNRSNSQLAARVTTYDAANRPAYLQGAFTNPTTKTTTVTPYIGNPASNPTAPIQYWPHGAIYAYLRGNNLEHAESYNGRLQLTESYESTGNGNTPAHLLFVSCPNWGLNPSNLNLYDICPHYSLSNGNGNLQNYAEYLGNPQAAQFQNFSQTFTYDHLNRLTIASDTYWSRNFSYDQWGNMAVTTPAATAIPLLNVNTPTYTTPYGVNNQLSSSSYDASGNLLSLQPNLTFTYDAENRQISAGSSTYSYDGTGHRVLRLTGGVTTYYLYDAMGLLAAEYSNVINTSPCATCYLSYDHLGSVRLVTDGKGNIISRHDFLPFGEEVPALASTGRIGPGWGVTDDVNQRFTGKGQDPESQLDYFGARYYGSALGRFTSPDWSAAPQPIPYAKLDNPQSLNLYAYAGNDPISRTDPDGHCDTPTGLKSGQVGICIGSFIKSSFFWGIGRGDGRSADPHGGTSRIETRLIVDPGSGTVSKTNETINRSGVLIKDLGPKGVGASTISKPTTDKQGDTHFQVSQDAHSSYSFGGTVLGSIDNHINLNVAPNGNVGIDPGSTARDFPSLEIFRYSVDAKGHVSSGQVLYKQESGNLGDLKQPERPIAPENPQ